MTEWFDRLVRDIVWKAVDDFFSGLAGKAKDKIDAKLASLTPGQKLASSPLVRVLAVDESADSITFLVRGRVPLWKKSASAFMRIEVVISRQVDLSLDGPPVQVLDWHTVVGDLDLSRKDVFEAKLALGYDHGTWLGRGALKLIPAGFGLDLFLGGLDDRGAMVGLDVDLPTPIPLGSTGLALKGMGGDFAYNFVARLEHDGTPTSDPTAPDYVAWARNKEVDRWVAGPIDQTAVGVGIRTDLRTLFDNGWTLTLQPIGLAVLTPGPTFVLGGQGKLLKYDSATVEAFAAVDIPSGSMAMGASVKLHMPQAPVLIDAGGSLAAFFSFQDPSAWYLRLGTESKPVRAEVLKTLNAEVWLDLDDQKVSLGAGISMGGDWSFGIIKLIAKLGATVAALIGWNPTELGGYLDIYGELALQVWKFKFGLSASARVAGMIADPTRLDARFKFKLDLPWPIPDITGSKTYSLSDAEPSGPPLRSPLLAGQATGGDTGSSTGELEAGGLHALTGRQWKLGATSAEAGAWPDLEVVVPFSARVRDDTGTVIGPAVSPKVEGGYQVTHALTGVELRDLVNDVALPDVKGVWAAGPGGDTARLHLLGADPFSWLTPHTDTIASASETPARYVHQMFGVGPDQPVTGERRFGELLVDPAAPAELVGGFEPALPTRVLRAPSADLRFASPGGTPIQVDRLVVFLLGYPPSHWKPATFETPGVAVQGPAGPGVLIGEAPVAGDLALLAFEVPLGGSVTAVHLASTTKLPLQAWAVRYREARTLETSWKSKTVLKPGRYRLALQGHSTTENVFHDAGAAPLPASEPVDWSLEQEFWIDYPETLRPYLVSVTAGDTRMLGKEGEPWNPTMYGVGFPAYRDYHAAVRFRVPYMSSIFPSLDLSFDYESGTSTSSALSPSPAAAGGSSLPAQAKDWVTAAGGSVGPDEEIVRADPLPEAGAARVRLSFSHPTRGQVKLDEWTCYASTFRRFAEQAAWPPTCLRIVYDAAGRRVEPCCPLPGSAGESARRVFPGGLHLDTGSWTRGAGAASAGPAPSGGSAPASGLHAVLPGPGAITTYTPGTPFPAELGAPPPSWLLPAVMTTCLGPLDPGSGVCFARFAEATGARFNAGSGGPLAGIGQTVETTSLEAVVDGEERPFALWLRTPEPLDWRRVSATLRIRHVTPPSGCPSALAHRHPLELDVRVLPSPDASSAFLVGVMGGQPTRLPRGQYELDLRFDPHEAGLPRLRPPADVGSDPEHMQLRFVLAFGRDWPLPGTLVRVPAGWLEAVAHRFGIPPDLLQQAVQEVGPPTPRPVPVTEPSGAPAGGGAVPLESAASVESTTSSESVTTGESAARTKAAAPADRPRVAGATEPRSAAPEGAPGTGPAADPAGERGGTT